MGEDRTFFAGRLEKHRDELRWLYMELYDNGSMFAELCDRMEQFYLERDGKLRDRDHVRETEAEAGSAWYRGNDLLGMMLYVDNFAGTLKGVEERLDYIQKCNVNVLHLMPFLKTEKGKSDGGYAVSDFRRVNDELGTMEDLAHLANTCHEKGINVCMDFVMNHTSECHEWARRARAGEGEYMSRYFFYEKDTIPRQFEQTVPQVFPTTAPGNFTWFPECRPAQSASEWTAQPAAEGGEGALPQIGHYVMTTFYPYQWDLNYRNPRVFNEMMYNFLYLANQGIDIFRIDAVPYIWKELGTSCRNLRQVHTIVRMMRMIAEIVCPGILLLGEVVMEPEKVAPYFGTIEKPECHMLYNVTTMATTWHTVATRDVRLLKKQLDTIRALPKDYVFLNYLRCHDDIGWGLDYDFLAQQGFEECAHKQYLNAYFLGKAGSSNSRGELYNDDPVTGDARFCGTTASMCGIEAAESRLCEGCPKEETELTLAISLDVMLHAYMLFLSGIPILYSGDEVAQKNDYFYREDPWKADDSRYIHRGRMDWEAVKRLEDADSIESRIFYPLARLEEIRRTSKVFVTNADVWTIETGDDSVLGIGRCFEGEKVVGLFNFCENDKTAWISEADGIYEDLLSGERMQMVNIKLPAYGFRYLRRCAIP